MPSDLASRSDRGPPTWNLVVAENLSGVVLILSTNHQRHSTHPQTGLRSTRIVRADDSFDPSGFQRRFRQIRIDAREEGFEDHEFRVAHLAASFRRNRTALADEILGIGRGERI